MPNIFSGKINRYSASSGFPHKLYYAIADITVKVESDSPISPHAFHQKFSQFEASSPTDDNISIRHHSYLPDIRALDLGSKVYDAMPWRIYRCKDKWIYVRIMPNGVKQKIQSLSVFTSDYRFGNIYHSDQSGFFSSWKSNSLSFLPSDQIILAQVLAYRNGCYMHACGIDWQGKGLLFLGQSGAGKSTIAKMFQGEAQILCDDRIIIRNHGGIFKIYGTWSHGDIKEISNKGVPLCAVYILQKDSISRVETVSQKKEVVKNLFICLIRPHITASWYQEVAKTISAVAGSIPCYRVFFNKSGDIVQLLSREIHGNIRKGVLTTKGGGVCRKKTQRQIKPNGSLRN